MKSPMCSTSENIRLDNSKYLGHGVVLRCITIRFSLVVFISVLWQHKYTRGFYALIGFYIEFNSHDRKFHIDYEKDFVVPKHFITSNHFSKKNVNRRFCCLNFKRHIRTIIIDQSKETRFSIAILKLRISIPPCIVKVQTEHLYFFPLFYSNRIYNLFLSNKTFQFQERNCSEEPIFFLIHPMLSSSSFPPKISILLTFFPRRVIRNYFENWNN